MTINKTSKLTKLFDSKLKKISITGIVLCLIGVIDTIDLTIAHFSSSKILACPDTGIINCAKVTTSSYSDIHGIPAPILGLIFFSVMLVFQLPWLWKSKSSLVKFSRLGWSIIGMSSVFWFVYVEFHKLHAICLYCTAVHILTFLLFVVTLIGTSILTENTSVDTES